MGLFMFKYVGRCLLSSWTPLNSYVYIHWILDFKYILLLLLFILVILNTSLQLMCKILHLILWYIVFIFHQNNICENSIGSVCVGGYCDLSESGLCVFDKLCPVGFL